MQVKGEQAVTWEGSKALCNTQEIHLVLRNNQTRFYSNLVLLIFQDGSGNGVALIQV